MCCSCRICAVVAIVIGLVIFLVGGVGYFIWPTILDGQLRKELVLSNSSKSFNLWKETPIPMYMEVHMFNWTNPEETLRGKAKPHFIEMGPYTFKEHHSKLNLTWNQNDTITFHNKRNWTFVPELSNGTLDDLVTNVNVIAVTVGDLLRRAVPSFILEFVDLVIMAEESKVYVTKSVRELIFDGYSDNFLNIFKALDKYKKIIKIKIPFDKFGWFYQRNNSVTYDGEFNMNTGASSLYELGNILEWNYKRTTGTYAGQCNIVRGSTGELWPTNSASADYIDIFASDMCRNTIRTIIQISVGKNPGDLHEIKVMLSISDAAFHNVDSSLRLSYAGSTSIAGVHARSHEGDRLTLDNGQLSPDNKCYCTNDGCAPNGARNVAKCRYGAPAYVSFPHFYLADESYRSKVTGMEPSENLHKTYILLDKITSIPVDVHARLQINILAQKIPGLRFFNGLPNAYMPMLWFDQRATITDDLAGQLQAITDLAVYVEPVLLGIIVFGICLTLVGVISRFLLLRKKSSVPQSPLLSSESTDSG